MNILIIGSGGREHALAWKIRQSKHCKDLFIAPGNAGTATVGINLEIKVNDFENLKAAALEHGINMIVVGPEDPLVNGIYDYFRNASNNWNGNRITELSISCCISTRDIEVIGKSLKA